MLHRGVEQSLLRKLGHMAEAPLPSFSKNHTICSRARSLLAGPLYFSNILRNCSYNLIISPISTVTLDIIGI